jgi:Ribbon-helix-helix protein, copG family
MRLPRAASQPPTHDVGRDVMAVKKASFNLPEEELRELRRLAAERNVSVTQALRQAIADSSFIERQIRDKNRLLIERQDGTRTEISILR